MRGLRLSDQRCGSARQSQCAVPETEEDDAVPKALADDREDACAKAREFLALPVN